jgi:putative redox protein
MKFDFLNAQGENLSGRFELPKGEIKATALFAHCFTCSKNVAAASSISKFLTASGIGVLRFDFTGLGQSEGDFSNTNFSSNVDDLVSACGAISKSYQSPKLLIGHSLGGAAVLKAAMRLPMVKAVVTIGAPSDVHHVANLFSDEMDVINSIGEASVRLAGRDFKIKKQFIEDIKESKILNDLENLKKALLVMHAPLDDTVSIEHAANIFKASKHPKSFVSLDTADHLLSDRREAEYAASVIGSWVSRYVV